MLMLACNGPEDSGDTETPPVVDPATVELDGACPMEVDLGGFLVESYEDYSIVDGRVADGVVPLTVLEELATEGSCRLLRRNNPHCAEGCGPDETCDFDGECLPYPTDLDLGTVSVLGLAVDVEMEPRTPGAHYFDTTLPHPALAADDLITVVTAGALGPQRLYGVGMEDLEPVSEQWLLVRGEALVVEWTAPTGLARSKVSLHIDIDQHGSSPASVHCDFPDTGSAEVPAAMVDALISAGVSGFPSGSLSRRTQDHQLVEAGCFDFTVASTRRPDEVRVKGYTPCDDQGDCPPGQVCDLDIEICVDS